MLADNRKNQLKTQLLLKLGNPTQVDDLYIDLALDQAAQKIKNYCSIDDIPSGLNQTLTSIARDYYLYYQAVVTANQTPSKPGIGSINSVDLRAVTEVKMGDTQIKLDGKMMSSNAWEIQQNAHSIDLDHILDPYKSDLVEYRRLVW